MDEQQVGLVVSVNYDKLKELYEFWEKNNDKARQQNKSTFASLKEGAEDFLKTTAKVAAGAAFGDFVRTVTSPINTTFHSAAERAKGFRDQMTDIAVSTGRNWKELAGNFEATQRATKRGEEELRAYASSVARVTNSWETALSGAEAYDKLARKTGRDMASFGGLAGSMENLFKLKGNKEVEDFFDRLIAKAARLGLNTNQAIANFEKLAPTLGRGGYSAEKAGEFSNAMLKAGASPEQAQELGNFWSGYFKNGTRWVEREMRSAGVLKKGQKLTDKFGRLQYSPQELIDMYYRTQKKIRRGMSDEMFREIAIENLGNEAGEMFANWPEFKKHLDAQQKADKGGELDLARQTYQETEAGGRRGKDVNKEIEDRHLGEKLLPAQDAMAGHGGITGAALTYGKMGLAGAAGAAAVALLKKKKEAEAAAKAASKAGGRMAAARAAAKGAGRFIPGVGAAVTAGLVAMDAHELYKGGLQHDAYDAGLGVGGMRTFDLSKLPAAAGAARPGQVPAATGQMSLPPQMPAVEQQASPREQAEATGKATADKLSEKILRVQVVGYTPAPIGGAPQ